MPAPAAPLPFAIYADGAAGVRRYLRLVEGQVEWGDVSADAHQFPSEQQAGVLLVGLSLDHQPGFGITQLTEA